MNAIADKKLRFSDAVFALDTTPKSLRKWLQNPEFKLVSHQNEGEWKNFSYADIACLGVMRKLVDFCVGVVEANEIATVIVKRRLGPLLQSKNMPPNALQSVFVGMTLVVWRSRDGWKFDLLTPDGQAPQESAVLVIDLEEVVGTAVSRAIDSLSDGRDSS